MLRTTTRILIVEDDAILRMALARMFAGFSIECDEARDGQVGLERLLSGRYELVLTDMRMPGKSGVEMLEAARAALDELPLFVLLSGYHDYALEDLRQAGFDRILHKPLPLEALRDEVLSLLDVQVPGNAASSPVASSA
ncbi:response regulator [Pseudenhygromyxa sp. WMMC2535]|uniref:response regulator n=1 Tax=Pseudenhygromyxa sp. WMMC2535 TaxID=2712867 RepID=UPI0015563D1F|nr:response regulator [Pseudenhygromyxa sp. WMMC2535]NVB37420.1 response regulator [Pseudenhygromyxa sp. WMMC2535]